MNTQKYNDEEIIESLQKDVIYWRNAYQKAYADKNNEYNKGYEVGYKKGLDHSYEKAFNDAAKKIWNDINGE